MTSCSELIAEYADVSLGTHTLSFSSDVSSRRSSQGFEFENDYKSTTFAETCGESLEIENPNKLAFLCEARALM